MGNCLRFASPAEAFWRFDAWRGRSVERRKRAEASHRAPKRPQERPGAPQERPRRLLGLLFWFPNGVRRQKCEKLEFDECIQDLADFSMSEGFKIKPQCIKKTHVNGMRTQGVPKLSPYISPSTAGPPNRGGPQPGFFLAGRKALLFPDSPANASAGPVPAFCDDGPKSRLA